MLQEAPHSTVVSQSFVRLDSLVIIVQLDHDVAFSLQQAVKDQLILEQRMLVMSELSYESLKHFLDRFVHLVNDDLFDILQLLVNVIDV